MKRFYFYCDIRGTATFTVEAETFEAAKEALTADPSIYAEEPEWEYDSAFECDDEKGDEQ